MHKFLVDWQFGNRDLQHVFDPLREHKFQFLADVFGDVIEVLLVSFGQDQTFDPRPGARRGLFP